MRREKKETPDHILGVYKSYKGGGYIYPTDKKIREDFFVENAHLNGAENGDLVWAETLPRHAGKTPARILEVLGSKDDPRLISLIAIHAQSIPTEFSAATLDELKDMDVPDLSHGRVDVRHIPLVTIDGADSRDFDDAVYAEEEEDGWRLLVAVADVSYYVRHGSSLDKEAFDRGNSTYFADRVVPMLPERLSNDLCSLNPGVPRACLAVWMKIDNDGNLKGQQFFRGLMRSAARLTYEQVEDAHQGNPDGMTQPLTDRVIAPLYKAYSILKRAREKRGALEIDLPERRALIENGVVKAIVPRKRLSSHQLIEEFMVLANVAAATALEEKHTPCVYRVHEPPSPDRLDSTRDFLREMGYSLPKAEHLQPKNINHILQISAEKEDKDLVHTLLLRTQSQAIYSPDNKGHFGLALKRYAHFTSPIRRYADLLVHRALVKSHHLGAGGLTEHEAGRLDEAAEHISLTERRSMMAERDVMDRFTAQYLSANIGHIFKGRISGVTKFGIFVSLEESGADGLVPMRSLPQDYYIHDEKRHALVGKRTGNTYRLAQTVLVRLVAADPMRGSTLIEVVEGEGGSSAPRQHRERREHHRPPAHEKKRDRKQKKKHGKRVGKRRKPTVDRTYDPDQ